MIVCQIERVCRPSLGLSAVSLAAMTCMGALGAGGSFMKSMSLSRSSRGVADELLLIVLVLALVLVLLLLMVLVPPLTLVLVGTVVDGVPLPPKVATLLPGARAGPGPGSEVGVLPRVASSKRSSSEGARSIDITSSIRGRVREREGEREWKIRQDRAMPGLVLSGLVRVR